MYEDKACVPKKKKNTSKSLLKKNPLYAFSSLEILK